MKKGFLKIASLVFVIVFALLAVGCTSHVVVDGDYVVIEVEADKVPAQSNLRTYMDYLVQKGELEYEEREGMIVSIGGKKGSSNQYWMLYTSDEQNANEVWGTCEYDGQIFGSAVAGIDDLVVKDGCIYIWYLQTF